MSDQTHARTTYVDMDRWRGAFLQLRSSATATTRVPLSRPKRFLSFRYSSSHLLVLHDGFNRLQACGRSAAASSPACAISFMMSSPPSSSPLQYS